MKQRLVILTTHFGNNFSGGSTATCEIFTKLEANFSEIVVIGTELGRHPLSNIKFKKYRNWFHVLKLLKQEKLIDTVFYGDFYNSFLLILARVKFHFTYHDNWPELGRFSFRDMILGWYYWFIYRCIFRAAESVVVVSEFKKSIVKGFNPNVHLIRNGIKSRVTDYAAPKGHRKFVMVGNIDSRKFKLAISLFQNLSHLCKDISIDIYGHIHNHRLANTLGSYDFIDIKGYSPEVPYQHYCCLIHTSAMENMSITWCEALAHGIPVITFDVGGAAELINTKNGVLIPPYDIEKMAEAIISISSSQKKFINTIQLPEEYSWEVASQQYLQLLSAY